jgi:HAD superfamily hydrolase (TIGR01549 family)
MITPLAAMPASRGTNLAHKAWLVDLDGTLYAAAPVRICMACELLTGQWGAIRSLRVFRRIHERLRRRCVTGDMYAAQLELTSRALRMEKSVLEHTVTQWMIIRPGKWLRLFRRRRLLDEIRLFKAQGGRAALVSDYPAQEKLRAMGLRELFDVVVASGEEGAVSALKPLPDAYLAAAARLGVRPEECLVLGDRLDADGLAARRAGMDFRLVK